VNQNFCLTAIQLLSQFVQLNIPYVGVNGVLRSFHHCTHQSLTEIFNERICLDVVTIAIHTLIGACESPRRIMYSLVFAG